jgi:uncharacterized protein (TIGR02391 family)
MTRKSKAPELRQAHLSAHEMQAAIAKIERRIADIKAFDINAINQRDDASIGALSSKLDALLSSIFGSDTVEYRRYQGISYLDTASMNLLRPTPIGEVREGLKRGLATAKAQLETIRSGFIEELQDSGLASTGKALKAYEGLELHSEIERAAGQLFKDGHYANAIEDAVKALNALVRLRSGIDDRDGTSLMEFVFSPKGPVLKLNSMADQSDIDEQKGFMMMFSGAVAGLRNPRAHKIIKDDAEMALEFIAFISLLAKFVEKAKK